MSRSYNITKTISFNESDGYWNLTVTINSASELNPRAFLLEKFIDPGDSISTSTNDPVYVRTILKGEGINVPTEADTTVTYDLASSGVSGDTRSRSFNMSRWAQYRTNTVTRKFYSYEILQSSLDTMTSILKSNVESYPITPGTLKPSLVVVNLSAKEKKSSTTSVDAYKGDVLSLQLVSGPTDLSVISDDTVSTVSGNTTKRTKSGSVAIKLLGDDHTYVGFQDTSTSLQYKITVNMLSSNETTTIEEII